MDTSPAGSRKPFTAELQRKKRSGSEPATGRSGSAAPQEAPNLATSAEAKAMAHELNTMREELRALNHMLRAQFEPDNSVEEDVPEDDPILREYERQKLEVNILKTELRALANSIQETKREIAQLRNNNSDSDRLIAVAGELDAIVGSTETATDGILDAAEKIDNIAHNLKSHGNDSYLQRMAEDITENIMVIFEHCNFQDITGQRTTKVVNTLKFVEDRIDKMIDIWGRDTFNELVQDEHEDEDDSRLLNGPQMADKAISQDEIDKLFD